MDRWTACLRTNASTGDTWKQVKEGAEPLLERTQPPHRRSALGWLGELKRRRVHAEVEAALEPLLR